MIEIRELSKFYGDRQVLHGLSFRARAGEVTAFLGPNGAGKSTTLRIALGLAAADSGAVTFDGEAYARLARPAATVGSLLSPEFLPPHLTGRQHLRWFAAASALEPSRISVVLDVVEMAQAADRRIGDYSLGMRQRLGLACALLGDPSHLVLDEPVNGLDPAGVRWLRDLLAGFAEDGRAVLVSSHLLSEVELLADRVVVISEGRLLADGPLADVTAGTNLEEQYLSLTEKAPQVEKSERPER
ncbi:hypothetical protein BJF78_22400 [Pseudonocardia sp. CNS-139]|nr:hypothetical protein BJF78_22400 [Pseudonocardia sp. CNS-139]